MSQNNTTNWILQGTNGQMIKLVQSSGKPVGNIVTNTISGTPVKIFKSPASHDDSMVLGGGEPSQIIRAVTMKPKIVAKTMPMQISSITHAGQKSATRTIRLTPTPQMQPNIKIISTPSPHKSVSGSIMHGQSVGKNISPPILYRKRPDPLDMDSGIDSKRSRRSEKLGKGLRHFSMKVCEKVQQKGTTTYNEVADELVAEIGDAATLSEPYDQKNIRRRVYDALNVLMAMNIISKEKKEIKWIGLPTNSLQECKTLEREKQRMLHNIKEKKKTLHQLIMNQIAFKNLAQRNKLMEETHGPPPPNSYIHLPFVVVNTNKKTVIDCSISNDKLEYLFKFNDRFEINDDVNILKSIGMLMGLDIGECSPENLEKIKSMVPKSLVDYVTKIANGSVVDDMDNYLDAEPGTSSSLLEAEDLVEAHLDESSHQSSSDPLSPSGIENFSDEDDDSDLTSDID